MYDSVICNDGRSSEEQVMNRVEGVFDVNFSGLYVSLTEDECKYSAWELAKDVKVLIDGSVTNLDNLRLNIETIGYFLRKKFPEDSVAVKNYLVVERLVNLPYMTYRE